MTDATTNPGDGEAMPEVETDLIDEANPIPEAEDEPEEGEQDDTEADEPEEEFEDIVRGEKTYRVPKSLAGELMMQADYTKKTQLLAEDRKGVDALRQTLATQQARQLEFTQEIAHLGALNARLQPYESVQDWPSYIRQGGAEAQAQYAEYQALVSQRDRFAQGLGQKVQQRNIEDQRETAKAIDEGRAEIAKHIKGYDDATLSKLEAFAEPFGFGSDEIRQAQSDPRSIRILHLAMVGQQALAQQKRTSTLAQGAKTKPVTTLRGSGGRIAAKPDTNDFAAFERMADEKLRA